LIASAIALPDISLGLQFAPAMTTSSTGKFSHQCEIYIDMPSNANATLTVKGKHICPGVLGGALWNGPA
jgi:hypothetical protein